MAVLLFLYSLKVGHDDLVIRKRIREIVNREDKYAGNSDSLMIKNIRQVLLGYYPEDSLKNRSFYYNDLKTAIKGMWNSDGTTYYLHKIVPNDNITIMTFVGFFPNQNKRKYITISLDSQNKCTLINLK